MIRRRLSRCDRLVAASLGLLALTLVASCAPRATHYAPQSNFPTWTGTGDMATVLREYHENMPYFVSVGKGSAPDSDSPWSWKDDPVQEIEINWPPEAGDPIAWCEDLPRDLFLGPSSTRFLSPIYRSDRPLTAEGLAKTGALNRAESRQFAACGPIPLFVGYNPRTSARDPHSVLVGTEEFQVFALDVSGDGKGTRFFMLSNQAYDLGIALGTDGDASAKAAIWQEAEQGWLPQVGEDFLQSLSPDESAFDGNLIVSEFDPAICAFRPQGFQYLGGFYVRDEGNEALTFPETRWQLPRAALTAPIQFRGVQAIFSFGLYEIDYNGSDRKGIVENWDALGFDGSSLCSFYGFTGPITAPQ